MGVNKGSGGGGDGRSGAMRKDRGSGNGRGGGAETSKNAFRGDGNVEVWNAVRWRGWRRIERHVGRDIP